MCTLFETPSTRQRTIAAPATSHSERASPTDRRRPACAPTAAAKHAGPRRAVRVLHRALLLFSTRGRQRANAVDLVSQGRPRSAV